MDNYNRAAEQFAKDHNLTLEVREGSYGLHFAEDREERWIFPCTLIRGDQEYSFRFGQSYAAGYKEPSMYDVLCTLQKHNPGDSLREFCEEYGYDIEDQVSEGIYELVLDEYLAMKCMFSEEGQELLYEVEDGTYGDH